MNLRYFTNEPKITCRSKTSDMYYQKTTGSPHRNQGRLIVYFYRRSCSLSHDSGKTRTTFPGNTYVFWKKDSHVLNTLILNTLHAYVIRMLIVWNLSWNTTHPYLPCIYIHVETQHATSLQLEDIMR